MYGNEGNQGMYEKPVKEGSEYDVTIEEIGVKGDGIARVQGFVVFVPNVKKGEKAKVRVTQVMRRFAIGEKVGAATEGAAEEAPAEEISVDEVSTEEAPAEEAPAEAEAPAEESTEETPAEESTEEAPAEESPAEETPAEESTEEAPAEEPAAEEEAKPEE